MLVPMTLGPLASARAEHKQKPLLLASVASLLRTVSGVIINPQGQLGSVVSSARFKTDIRPMDEASEAILALKPVT